VNAPIRAGELEAEGRPAPRRFTVSDVWRMQEAGVIRPDEQLELIGGELIVMQAKRARHEIMKSDLADALRDRLPRDLRVIVETTLYLADDVALEPDILVYPRAMNPEAVRGPDVLLAVEIADTSLSYDLTDKAALYAAFGVRDYWVVDVKAAALHVHAEPLAEGGSAAYRRVVRHGARAAVPLPFMPEVTIRLSELG